MSIYNYNRLEDRYLNADPKVAVEITNRSYYLVRQAALDKKMLFKNEDDMKDLGRDGKRPLAYYNGMIAINEETGDIYVWTESNTGLLPDGYKYPKYYNPIYADKTFNFVLLKDYLDVSVSLVIYRNEYLIAGTTNYINIGTGKTLLDVFVNGLEQSSTDYSYDTNTGILTFNFDLEEQDIVSILYTSTP